MTSHADSLADCTEFATTDVTGRADSPADCIEFAAADVISCADSPRTRSAAAGAASRVDSPRGLHWVRRRRRGVLRRLPGGLHRVRRHRYYNPHQLPTRTALSSLPPMCRVTPTPPLTVLGPPTLPMSYHPVASVIG